MSCKGEAGNSERHLQEEIKSPSRSVSSFLLDRGSKSRTKAGLVSFPSDDGHVALRRLVALGAAAAAAHVTPE